MPSYIETLQGGPTTPSILESAGAGLAESARAVAFVLGAYTPASPEEERALTKRAISDGIFTAVAAASGGLAGAAIKGVSAPIRALVAAGIEGVGGAAGGAAGAAAVGEDPKAASLSGGIFGAALGGLGGAMRGRGPRPAPAQKAAPAKPMLQLPAPPETPITPGLLASPLMRGTMKPQGMIEAAIKEGDQVVSVHGAPGTYLGKVADDAHFVEFEDGARLLRDGEFSRNPSGEPLSPLPTPREGAGTYHAEPEADIVIPAPGKVVTEGKVAPVKYRAPRTKKAAQVAADLPPTGPSATGPYVPRNPEVMNLADELGKATSREEVDRIVARHRAQNRPPGTFQSREGGFMSAGMVDPSMQPGGPPIRTVRGPKGEVLGEELIPEGFSVPRVEPAAAKGSKRVVPPTRAAMLETYYNESNFGKLVRALDSFKDAHEGVGRVLAKVNFNPYKVAQLGQDISKVWNRAFSSAESILNKMSGPVRLAVKQMRRVENATALRTAPQVLALSGMKKLSAREAVNLFDVLEGSAIPKTPLVESLATKLRVLFDEIDVELQGKFGPEGKALTVTGPTGKKLEYMSRKNFVPYELRREYRNRVLTKGTPENLEAIKRIMKMDWAESPAEAHARLLSWFDNSGSFTDSHMGHVRLGIFPEEAIERDVRKTIPHYLYRTYRRIEQAKTFGPNNEELNKVLAHVAETGEDYDFVKKVIDHWTNTAPRDYSTLVGALRSWNVVSMLTYSGLLQPAQLSNILAYTSTKNLLKSLSLLVTDDASRKWARGVGAHLSEAIQDIMPMTEGGIARMHVKWIGLEPADKANRFVAALAGRLEAEQTASRLFLKPQDKLLRSRAAHLGFDPDVAISQMGQLTDQQLREVGLHVSQKTQFMSSVLSSPLFKQTPLGDMLYLFRSFAFQQLKFDKDIVAHAIKTRDFAPVMRTIASYGLLGGTVGEGVRWSRHQLEGKPYEPRSMASAEFLLSALDAGALGMATSIFSALDSGQAAVAGFMVGPTGGMIAQLAPEIFHGDTEKMSRSFLRMGGPVGKALANSWFPKGE